MTKDRARIKRTINHAPEPESAPPLANVGSMYATLTREQLIERLDCMAQNYNELERARDCLQAQKSEMQTIADEALRGFGDVDRALEKIDDVDCPHDDAHPFEERQRVLRIIDDALANVGGEAATALMIVREEIVGNEKSHLATSLDYRLGWEDGLDRAAYELRKSKDFDGEAIVDAVPRDPNHGGKR